MDSMVKELFEDAENLYSEAFKDLGEGRIRDAAEKAWGATVRATEALLVLHGYNYEEIRWPVGRRRALDELALKDPRIDELGLVERYGSRETLLHGACFYEGICEPVERNVRRIKETIDYIKDAKALAGLAK